MILTDMHTHTSFSPDAESSPEEMCERAAQLGLAKYAVTDHCDCNFWLPGEEFSYPEYQQRDKMMFGARDYAAAAIRRVSELKERYPFLICGIELGQPQQLPSAAEQILAMPELDFVIGSLHMVEGYADFYWLEYNKTDINDIYRLLGDYFEQILEMCRQSCFDVLAHLTYPLRYIVGVHGIELDMNRFYEIIREIFLTLADNGLGMEINTSGLRQRYRKMCPDLEYVKLYKKCGGKILTVGSDAHKAADIASGIPEAVELARESGFKYISYFERRRPEFITI